MILTKDEVITALKTEPLTAGHWIRRDEDLKTCQVCAIGAVIRSKVFKTIDNFHVDDFDEICRQATDNQYVEEYPKELIKKGNYLGALSCYLENMKDVWDHDNDDFESNFVVTPEIRTMLIDFVIDNFPNELELKTKETKENE